MSYLLLDFHFNFIFISLLASCIKSTGLLHPPALMDLTSHQHQRELWAEPTIIHRAVTSHKVGENVWCLYVWLCYYSAQANHIKLYYFVPMASVRNATVRWWSWLDPTTDTQPSDWARYYRHCATLLYKSGTFYFYLFVKISKGKRIMMMIRKMFRYLIPMYYIYI